MGAFGFNHVMEVELGAWLGSKEIRGIIDRGRGRSLVSCLKGERRRDSGIGGNVWRRYDAFWGSTLFLQGWKIACFKFSRAVLATFVLRAARRFSVREKKRTSST